MIPGPLTRHWYDPEAVELWSDRSIVQAWFEVEVALAAAQAQAGLIPASAAKIIAAKAAPGRVDMERIARDIAFTLHPFVPALRQLEEQCGKAAAYLHWGATTQNIFDTGFALLLKRNQALVIARLVALLEAMASLAHRTRAMPEAGRTHGQHAAPISFGFKIAAWMGEMRRHGERLRALEPRVFVARMGGAVGSFAAQGGKGRAVQAGLAKRLGLFDGEIPSRAAIDHFAEYVGVLALMCATIEKIAKNLIDLQRTEIAEVAEAFHHGKVGSSTMPQKRNPTRLMNVLGLAKLMRLNAPGALDAMVQTDEGDGAAYNVADLAMRQGCVLALSALTGLAQAVSDLTVDPEAMKANLARSRGLIMTEAVMMRLAPHIGRHHAHEVMYDIAMSAFEAGEDLAAAFARHPETAKLKGKLDAATLFDAASYLGEAPGCVDDERRRSGAWIKLAKKRKTRGLRRRASRGHLSGKP